MKLLEKLNQNEATTAINDIPKGIGIEATDKMKDVRIMLKELEINSVHKIAKGKTKTISVRKKNKQGDLVDTGKTRTIDENLSIIDQAVRYLNKKEGSVNGWLVLFKRGGNGEYNVSRVSKAVYDKFKKEYKKDGKSVVSFDTREWRKNTK
jgi:hypothetical protein